MCTDYHLLWADENTNRNVVTPSGLGWTNSGKFRGQLITWWLKYALTENLTGHLVLEYFVPGNYYISSSRDDAIFARAQIEYKF
jgi:hypothetical protein